MKFRKWLCFVFHHRVFAPLKMDSKLVGGFCYRCDQHPKHLPGATIRF